MLAKKVASSSPVLRASALPPDAAGRLKFSAPISRPALALLGWLLFLRAIFLRDRPPRSAMSAQIKTAGAIGCRGNGRLRRIFPIAARPGNGLLSEPKAVTQPRRREPLF